MSILKKLLLVIKRKPLAAYEPPRMAKKRVLVVLNPESTRTSEESAGGNPARAKAKQIVRVVFGNELRFIKEIRK